MAKDRRTLITVLVSIAVGAGLTFALGTLGPRTLRSRPDRTMYTSRSDLRPPERDLVAFGLVTRTALSTRVEYHLVRTVDADTYAAMARVGLPGLTSFEAERFRQIDLTPELMPAQPDDEPVRTTSVQEVATGFPFRSFFGRRITARTLSPDSARELLGSTTRVTHGTGPESPSLSMPWPTTLLWRGLIGDVLFWSLVSWVAHRGVAVFIRAGRGYLA